MSLISCGYSAANETSQHVCNALAKSSILTSHSQSKNFYHSVVHLSQHFLDPQGWAMSMVCKIQRICLEEECYLINFTLYFLQHFSQYWNMQTQPRLSKATQWSWADFIKVNTQTTISHLLSRNETQTPNLSLLEYHSWELRDWDTSENLGMCDLIMGFAALWMKQTDISEYFWIF